MEDRHLLIIGASISGLAAAAAASEHFTRITLIERDRLVPSAEPRAGVPQGTQIHALLPVGLERLEELLPGVTDDLLAAGCDTFDEQADCPLLSSVGWRMRVKSLPTIAFRRPLLELVIRRRVLALGNVTVVYGSARGLVLSDDQRRVEGVRLRDGSVIDADFVIDSSGRRTRSPDWITEHGYDKPTEVRADAYMGYATQFVRIPDDVLGDIRGIVALPIPGHLKGGVLLPADNGVHSLSAVGMMRDYPPREQTAFLEFLDHAPTPLLGAIARRSEPVSEIRTYHQDGNLRRKWETVVRPDRFLAVGDAVASFNPVYGQGITLAASAGALLREALAAGPKLDGLASRVQDTLAKLVDDAFSMSAAVDATFPGVQLVNFTAPTDEEVRIATALDELATVDARISYALGEATWYIRPEVLETPEVHASVERWLATGQTAAQIDPARYPQEVIELDGVLQ